MTNPLVEAAFICIRIQDAAEQLLETRGLASTEEIARAAKADVADTRGVMSSLFQMGAVRYMGSLQVWILAKE